MKIRIKKRQGTTTAEILALASYLKETGYPVGTTMEQYNAAKAYADDKPVKETGGTLWHLSLFQRAGGPVKTYCGASIKEPFMNPHPGAERCSSCYLNGYPGDGVIPSEEGESLHTDREKDLHEWKKTLR